MTPSFSKDLAAENRFIGQEMAEILSNLERNIVIAAGRKGVRSQGGSYFGPSTYKPLMVRAKEGSIYAQVGDTCKVKAVVPSFANIRRSDQSSTWRWEDRLRALAIL